jgi:hypothetical protein
VARSRKSREESRISPREVIINARNWRDFLAPHDQFGVLKARGCIPRPYDACPVGYLACARPFDLPLIPQSEWQARLDAQIEAKAQLSDVRNRGNGGAPIPSRDQNGKGYCATADTEVLTERGWVAYPDYDWLAPLATVNPLTHALEFQRPFERHVYEYDGPMFYSTNRRVDFGVTPDHQLYVRKWDERRRALSDRYSFVRAADLGWYAGLLSAPTGQIGTELVEVEVPGDRRYDGDDFLALLSLVISDGYAGGSDSTRSWVSFASFRPELRLAVAALAARVGFRENPGRPGVWTRYNAGALAAWLRENCYCDGRTGARAKCAPALVKCASVRQIRHFLHWYGDRSISGQVAYWSVSRRLIDDLQELHLRIGKRSTIRSTRSKESVLNETPIHSGPGYVLTVSDTDRLCLGRTKHIETDRYKGLVYCAAVPNHTLLTRRNGSVLISSNCWAHSSTSAALIVRAVAGEPYADLSAYAVACIIKGYRDEGGWGAESLEFIAERGIPTSQFWPQQSMSRANDKPETWANAAQHKFTEWMDLEPRNKAQLVTCLLSGIPVVIDLNWWGHSVCALDLVSLAPFRTRIWNSWNDTWSENGTGILEGQRAIPDGQIAPRVSTPSQT